jgi:membrane protein
VRSVLDIGMKTYAAWREDRTHRLGAGLAYYALFTIIPLLALTAALAEWLFGVAEMQEYFADRLSQTGIIDAEAASEAIASNLNDSGVQSSLGLIGLGSLLFAASVFFIAFTDAINVIWKVPVGSGVWHSVRRRLTAFVMVLTTGGVLIAGLAVSAVTNVAKALIPGQVKALEDLSEVLSGLATWVSLALAMALLFRFLTPVRVPWRGALVAGVVTALLLAVGTSLTGWYLRSFGGASVAGAFGAILATLTWIYFEAQILLGGVQLVKVLMTSRGPALHLK